MEQHLLYADLFDCYGKLLTGKQQSYFKAYYFDNLTLSEIAEEDGVSRNAVHKSLHDAVDKLNEYESQLQFYKKKKKVLSMIEDADLRDKISKILN